MNSQIKLLSSKFSEVKSEINKLNSGPKERKADGNSYPKEWERKADGNYYPKQFERKADGNYYPAHYSRKSDGTYKP